MGKTFKDSPNNKKVREELKKRKSGIDFNKKNKNYNNHKKKFKYTEEDEHYE